MGKHSGSGTGNPDQGAGKHVDTSRQPTGRGLDKVDRASDNELDPGDPFSHGGKYDS